MRQPKIITCRCGRSLTCPAFTNTCTCGRDYNSAGQLLAPRAQWGEETGETADEILAATDHYEAADDDGLDHDPRDSDAWPPGSRAQSLEDVERARGASASTAKRAGEESSSDDHAV